jgi:hypothetical protein
MRKAIAAWLVLAAVMLQPTAAMGWGAEAHRAINRAAAEKLPPDMPRFLGAATSRLEWLGPEPDRWRSSLERPLAEAQAPDHFIDLEYLDWLKTFPADRYGYIRAVNDYRAAHPAAHLPPAEKIGFQPYITIEIYHRLKVAFREYRHALREHRSTANARANAIFYAGWLGHYVADGSNPMHVSIHYNGWVGPNPKRYSTRSGVHAKMETAFVNANPEVLRIAPLVEKPVRLRHPFADYIAYLRRSQSKIERVYQLEKAGGFDGRGTAASRRFVRRQVARGAQMLRNLWYTAWLESAREP